MTIPAERTRALIYAAKFLYRLANPSHPRGIKKVPAAVREEALAILKHFPKPHDVYALAESNPDVLDPETILHYADTALDAAADASENV